MNLHKTINLQRIIIAILLVISIIITLACYKLQLTATAIIKENDRLNRQIEYYKSVVMDLEENLRKGESEDV